MISKIKIYLDKNSIQYEQNKTHIENKDIIFIKSLDRDKVLPYLKKIKANIDWSYCGDYKYIQIILK